LDWSYFALELPAKTRYLKKDGRMEGRGGVTER